jgi:hypothetical protein
MCNRQSQLVCEETKQMCREPCSRNQGLRIIGQDRAILDQAPEGGKRMIGPMPRTSSRGRRPGSR